MRRRTERRQLADTQKYIDDMNGQLEESRRSVHDFNKHIRYLRNIVATESKDEQLIRRVGDYCETMLDSYEKEETLLQLDDPVLRALLYGRQTQASRQRIKFLLEATSVLPVFPLKTHQMVEVFDNLIDNAFECVEGLSDDERWVRIRLSVESAGEGCVRHKFSVENPAPAVDMSAVVSTKAYTSKGGHHRGIGLRHVGQLVSATGGRLILSHQNGTFQAMVMYE
jgi:sensor histidine kinase regulating citrate/malate metabolism